MLSFSVLLATCTFVSGALALPANATLAHLKSDLTERAGTPSETGTNNGFYYSFWTNGGGTVTYTNGDAGSYTVDWTDCGDFTAGKGWNPGSAQDITFSGDFAPEGNAYLSIYGWFENPLVEYYIVESYGDYNPSTGLSSIGTVTSDGATYDIYTHEQVDQPSIEGTATFNQYFSVRRSLRTSGTVTVANHWDAWESLGLSIGTPNYQILSTEGYESSGSSSMTVSAA